MRVNGDPSRWIILSNPTLQHGRQTAAGADRPNGKFTRDSPKGASNAKIVSGEIPAAMTAGMGAQNLINQACLIAAMT